MDRGINSAAFGTLQRSPALPLAHNKDCEELVEAEEHNRFQLRLLTIREHVEVSGKGT